MADHFRKRGHKTNQCGTWSMNRPHPFLQKNSDALTTHSKIQELLAPMLEGNWFFNDFCAVVSKDRGRGSIVYLYLVPRLVVPL